MVEFLKNRIKSFNYAIQGLIKFYSSEIHAKIHLAFAFVAAFGGFYFKISTVDWSLLIMTIGIVFIAEIINTSIEKMMDIVSPHFNEKVKHVKDIAAASVLIAALVSIIIGLLIFIKYLL